MSSSRTERAPQAGSRPRVEVVMPQMGVSVAEGTIVSWLKRPGDEVAADETVAEVSTDKIDVEIPAPASGVLESVEVDEGETVAVGTVLALIAAAEARAPKGPSRSGGQGEAHAGAVGTREIDRSEFVSPVVRRIAAEHGIDLTRVEGHGIGGRIRKRDLLDHLERAGNGEGRPLHTESPYRPEKAGGGTRRRRAVGIGDADPPEEVGGAELVGPTRREPLGTMRRAIARHMVASRRTSAHCTTVVEVDFGAVSDERRRLKEEMGRRGVSLTYLAFVARATVEALGRHPILNASIDGEEIVYHEDANLGIAVALEHGLVVPVIRKAQRLSLEGTAAAIGDVAAKAREGRLEPDDVNGGTFTITNPGQFGALLATPIINQPQVAILDLEAVVRRPVVIDTDEGSSIGIRPISHLCMSWDHRALDGAEAARFLADVRGQLEAGAIR